MQGRNGAPMSRTSSQTRVAVSDIRGGKMEGEDRGLASSNYFKPGVASTPPYGGSDDRVSNHIPGRSVADIVDTRVVDDCFSGRDITTV
jgi:hypothetical protein